MSQQQAAPYFPEWKGEEEQKKLEEQVAAMIAEFEAEYGEWDK